MEKSVFEFQDYKRYLTLRLPTTGEGRGLRAKLASTLSCQAAYISQVINGHTQFSLEHAVSIDRFLGHSAEEGEYFMLLVHFARAGTKSLREYYGALMERMLKRRQVVTERIGVAQPLSSELANRYYSAWYYSAIHVLLLVPRFRTKAAIVECLHLPLPLVSEVIEFLVGAGLAKEEKGRYVTGTQRIHLGSDSPLLSRHHTNWHLRAFPSLDRPLPHDLHYSGAIALSEKNALRVRSLLLNQIEAIEPILAEAHEEAGFCLMMDFFRL